MRQSVPGYAHSFATFRFVVSVFLLLIMAVSIGQFWTYHTLKKNQENNRKTLCALIGVFVEQPRNDLTPQQEEQRMRTFRAIDDLINCGFSQQSLSR
jgi:hypothetical protein